MLFIFSLTLSSSEFMPALIDCALYLYRYRIIYTFGRQLDNDSEIILINFFPFHFEQSVKLKLIVSIKWRICQK